MAVAAEGGGVAPTPTPTKSRKPTRGSSTVIDEIVERATSATPADSLSDWILKAAGAPAKPAFDPRAVPKAYDALAATKVAAAPTWSYGEGGTIRTPEYDYGQPMATETRGEETANARRALDIAQREQRERSLDVSMPEGQEKKPIRKQVDRLTPEAYEDLTPDQQSAVNFNALLVNAVRKDKRLQGFYKENVDAEEKGQYREATEAMFGPGGGSKTYAPETLGLLRQVDYNDPAGDLDDFLKLRAAFRPEDLDNLQLPTTPPAVTVSGESPLSNVQLDRINLSHNLIQGQRDVRADRLEGGAKMLDLLGPSVALERSFDVSRFGGKQSPLPTGIGHTGDWDEYVDSTLGAMSDPERPFTPELVKSTLQGDLSAAQMKKYMAYADKHVTDPRVRKLLGLKVKEGTDGTAE